MAEQTRWQRSKVSRVGLSLGLALGAVMVAAPSPISAGFSSAPPVFTKAFSPDVIGPGSTSTLIFTLDNSSNGLREDIAFTDVLPASPAGLSIATPAQASTTCSGDGSVGPTLTAPDGGTTITLSGASVGAGDTCNVFVDVIAFGDDASDTTYTNTTGNLFYSDGVNADVAGGATDDLMVDIDRPGFSKSFFPSTVSFGGRSTLTLTIDNTANAAPVPNLDFTDNLPTGMTVANPSNKATDCGTATIPALVTAAPGSSTITLDSNGTAGFPAVAAAESCTVSVDVIGGSISELVNSVELLAEFVSAGKATAALEVTGFSGLLQLTKEFTDDPVAPGGTTTLEFTVTNKSRDDAATAITFDDDLENTLAGLTPTLPADPDPPCGAGSTLSFSSGVLTLTGGSLSAEGSCTFSVEVSVPADSTPGTYPNSAGPVSGDVGGSPVVGNVDGDLLFVVAFPLLTKEFVDDPVGTGGTATVEFTITNTSTASVLTDVEFLDELTDGSGGIPPDATSGFLPFPVTVGLPPVPNPPCGGSSSLSVVAVDFDRQALSLDGGSLAANDGSPGGPDTCSFTVTVDIPDGLAAGTYTNTTEEISAVLDDLPGDPVVTGPAASDDIVIVAAPQLTKEFTDDPAVPGGTATLEFTLFNSDDTNAASDIAFSDDLDGALSGLVASGATVNTCGGMATSGFPTGLFVYAGGTLAPEATCTIILTLDVPSGVGGRFTNTTSPVSATVAGLATANAAASDDLVVAGVLFSKTFDNPVIPGAETTLTFTLDNIGVDDAINISFSDDLAAILPGSPDVTVVTPLPDTSSCGAGSSLIEGGTFLSFSGGVVDAGTSCSFDVTVLVPAAADDGNYLNVTSALTYSAPGAVTGPPAVDVLEIDSALLAMTKQFTDDPATPGDTTTLVFTIGNLSLTETVTDIAFGDDLDATLTGLTTSSVDTDDCGGTPAGIGTGLFGYSGGTLAPGASCTIELTLDVPAGPFTGNLFPNTTSVPTGKVGALDVTGNAATDTLRVDTVTFTKAFDGPTTATGTALLTFTITNLNSATGVNPISFSDNLGNVLAGLVASALPAAPCGAGSTLAGSSFLTLTGGNLPPSGSCTFSVTVNVPAGTPAGNYPNTTSALTSAGLTIADPATADLTIEPPPTFAKVFAPDSIAAGATSTLTFTIDNSASLVDATGLAFTDNLPAGVVVATPSAAATDCTGGTLTAPDGAASIAYTGGSVAAGASCTVDVDVTSIAGSSYVNTTGDLTSTSGNSGTATDTLTVAAVIPPTFAKAFAPDTIVEGQTSTLTFTIDNTASLVDATGLAFTDNLSAGVAVATPAGAGTNCTGGTLTAPDGGATIAYSGGSVAASASCTISVDVTSVVAADHVNLTGDLTSSAGSSGTATDTLTVTAIAPAFTKVFAPDTIVVGQTSTLTFTIDNSASANTATGLTFTDNLPAGVVVATPSNKTTTCTGGTVSAPDGGAAISYSGGAVAPGTTCSVSVVVTASSTGTKVNTTGDLISSSGNSGTASDSLVVAPGTPPSVTIDQAEGQADPTNSPPVEFAVVFSETVTGFDAAGVSVTNGTVDSVSGSGTTYSVLVDPVADGDVTATVLAGAAVDGEGTANDASTSTDNAVRVDTVDPVINTPGDISTTADPGAPGAIVTYEVTTNDEGVETELLVGSFSRFGPVADGIVLPGGLSCRPASGSLFSIGTTTVTCTATDLAGNSSTASFDVEVVDDENPIIIDPGTLTAMVAGSRGAVNYPLPTATHNSGSVTVTCVPPPGTVFDVGTTRVTCTATDGSGNTATLSFNLVVTSPRLPATGGSGGIGGVSAAMLMLMAGLGLVVFSRIGRRRRSLVAR